MALSDPRTPNENDSAPPTVHTNPWQAEPQRLPPPAYPPLYPAATDPAPQPGVYPPPPEYYLPRQVPPSALPSPPPEHAQANGAAYPTFAPDGRVDPQQMRADGAAQPSRRGAAGGAVGGGMVLGLLAKFGLFAKLLLPLGSVLVSFAVYAALAGPAFALGLIALLFIHEMGHFVVIRAKGLPASLPVFIPLLGAYVAMRRMPHNVRDEAEIAIAGPLAGALAGAVCFGLSLQFSGSTARLFLILAYFSFFLNLVNLIPVSPLDGGRIVGAISRWLWPVGLVLLAAAFLYTFSLFLLLLGWLWFSQTLARFRMSREMEAYYHVSVPVRIYISVLYFGLAAGLALAMFASQNLLIGGGRPLGL